MGHGSMGCARIALAGTTMLAWGCSLEEVTIVDVEPVVVAEVYVDLGSTGFTEIRAFLHRTLGADLAGLPDLAEAVPTVRRGDGLAIRLVQGSFDDCVESADPTPLQGVCFVAAQAEAELVRPGDLLELDVALPDGGELRGATEVPFGFALTDMPFSQCRLSPNTLMTVRWSRSEGSWAYLDETSIEGLPDALRDEGIAVRQDPLTLLGLSISDQDTTIVFPSEFGLFSRFDLDQDLAVRLQRGLPSGTVAKVTITAVDRNYVNWARGGSFNPSGQVRVASLRGDGTGVFASTYTNGFLAIVEESSPAYDCPTPALP